MSEASDMTSFIRGFVLLGLHWVQAKDDRIECFVDEAGDKKDPNNIYRCDKVEKCCHEQGMPTCCTEKPAETAAWEQAQLWGTVAALIIILALLMWYCRHDGNCCGKKKDKGDKGGCCGGSDDEDDSDVEVTSVAED